MASQRRSVWELRFKAIQEEINREINNTKMITGLRAINETLNDEDRIIAKNHLATYRKIKERISLFETKQARHIWLEMDN